MAATVGNFFPASYSLFYMITIMFELHFKLTVCYVTKGNCPGGWSHLETSIFTIFFNFSPARIDHTFLKAFILVYIPQVIHLL
jgi:hypothetical protein